jgi:hypothetical protein
MIYLVCWHMNGDWDRSMGYAGSLTSCPGPKTAAVAAMCNSGYRKTFHLLHLLLTGTYKIRIYKVMFFSPSPNDGEIE